MPVLTAIDVIGIQSYVFASNRLRDVVGASLLVEWATSKEVGGGLDVGGGPSRQIIMAAGGNAILSFKNHDDAKVFVLHYTRRLLDEAPGLDVAVAHYEYRQGQLARGLLALQVKLAAAKLNRRPHAPRLGLGVMQPCAITGLPASELSRDFGQGQWVSRRIAKLRGATRRADSSRWDSVLDKISAGCGHVRDRKLRFPNELDKMGRTRGDTSLIGVVHVDGNGIGRRIQHWLVTRQTADDESVKNDISNRSKALDDLVKSVFQAVLKRLIDCVRPKDENANIYHVQGQPDPPRQLDFDLSNDGDTILLPIRPILLGGDDLTFVCDGRLALDLAATALKAFPEESKHSPDLLTIGTEPITACAGVALVRAHAPFRRSYDQCEVLCASAKQAKRDAESIGLSGDTGCWLDWHIGAVRPEEPLQDIRRRQYGEEKLTWRPYPLNGDPTKRLTWEWLDEELLGEPNGHDHCHSFRNPQMWGERRNKVKTLARLVRDENEAIKSQLEAWRRIERTIDLPKPLENGFKGGRTPLLDAVELLDIHLRLEPLREATSSEAGSAPIEAEVPR